jgi:hypothetical protein
MTIETRTPVSDFSALYMYLRDLQLELAHAQESTYPGTIETIKNILDNKPHADQKNARVLFQSAAEILTNIICQARHPDHKKKALTVLEDFVFQTLGNPCMSAAQALGNLPLDLPTPCVRTQETPQVADIPWKRLLALTPFSPKTWQWAGRSLIGLDPGSQEVLVLKFAKNQKDVASLASEVAWMECLEQKSFPLTCRCELPHPLRYNGTYLFTIRSSHLSQGIGTIQGKAIAYTVHKDYFVYPCSAARQPLTSSYETFEEIIGRASYLLGQFTSQGIIHTAPIPLFHNQTQQSRRDDQGLYLWPRKGRLDSWLHSCFYPNFGLSGLRDFEHLGTVNSRHLFQDIGTHLLSLFLVTGSYFRLLKPEHIGLNKDGTPYDMRHLFDPVLMEDLLTKILQNYFQGFLGQPLKPAMPGHTKLVVRRMIEEMGVDRYMNEIVRIRDQLEMTDTQFFDFLVTKGMPPEQARSIPKGTQEISLHTGPHLGEFNGQISLPELIDFTAGAAAICVSAKHFMQRKIPLPCTRL